jgi:hypothetical protein
MNGNDNIFTITAKASSIDYRQLHKQDDVTFFTDIAIYIAGRLRTASNPSKTWMLSAS